MNTISWTRYEPGTWQPADHNEFHNCSLFVASYGVATVQVHRTKDARRWVARAYTQKSSVPNGRLFNTRIAAFWDAINRLGQNLEARSA
jgi:hypothetical protein